MKAPLHRTALIAAVYCGLAGWPARGQDYGVDTVPFPSSPTSEPVVQAWINRYLPTRGYAIGAWSPHVVMLVSVDGIKADAYPTVSTDVLTETLTAKAANAAGWRAALQTLAFDCAADQYRTVSSLYFARGDRKGRFDQEAGSEVWLMPEAGATMDTVERAACFYGKRKHDSALAPAAPAAAPAPPAAAKPSRAKAASAKANPVKHPAPHHAKARTAASKSKRPASPPAKPARPAPQPVVTPQLRGFVLQ